MTPPSALATKHDVAAVTIEIANLRGHLKSENATLRGDLKSDIADPHSGAGSGLRRAGPDFRPRADFLEVLP